MLTLVGEIRRYRNDRYYYLLLKQKNKKTKLCLQNNQIKGAKQYNQYSPKQYNMFIECKHQHPALTAIWNCSQNDFTYVHDQNMWLIYSHSFRQKEQVMLFSIPICTRTTLVAIIRCSSLIWNHFSFISWSYCILPLIDQAIKTG